MSHEHNAASRFAEQANSAPDGRLRNKVRDIAFCAHESRQLRARYAKDSALGDPSRSDERPLCVQKVQFAGEIKSAVMSDDLHFATRNRQRDSDLAVKHDKHIDLPLARNKELKVLRQGLLSTVRTKTLDHLLCELGKGEFGPKVRNVRRKGIAVSIF